MSGGFPLLPELCNASDIGSSLTTMGTQTTNGNNAFGSWVQLTASCPHDVSWMDVSLYPTQNSSVRVAWQIGIGAAGSEVVLVDSLMAASNTSRSAAGNYSFPISVPAGTRIAARSSGNAAADAGNGINLRVYDSDFFHDGCGGVDAIGYASATTTGTTVTAGNPAGTKGSYAQLIASTSRDYFGFLLASLNGSAGDWGLIDIAIGAAGSEQIIVPNLGIHFGQASASMTCLGPFFVPIPAGSRVAIRSDADVTLSLTSDFVLYGLYK